MDKYYTRIYNNWGLLQPLKHLHIWGRIVTSWYRLIIWRKTVCMFWSPTRVTLYCICLYVIKGCMTFSPKRVHPVTFTPSLLAPQLAPNATNNWSQFFHLKNWFLYLFPKKNYWKEMSNFPKINLTYNPATACFTIYKSQNKNKGPSSVIQIYHII